MKEDNNHINHQELCAKYLSGNATDAEVQQLEGWVLSSTDHKAQFLAYKKAWTAANLKSTQKAIDVDKLWVSTESQLAAESKVVPLQTKRSSGIFLKIAAAIALLLGAMFWLFQSNDITTGNTLAVLSESEVKEEQFSDGTRISLNQFSNATYSTAADGTRQVNLQGDAFFDVARDTDHPFVIQTQSVNIEVLGTSFYVDSREEQAAVQVIVKSGKVSVAAGGQTVTITKNQMAVYDKSNNQLTVKPNTNNNYMAWKTKELIYNNTPLDEVVFDLNRTFHAQIKLDNPNLKNCPITTRLEGKSLESILRIIEKTLTLKTNVNGAQTVISGSPCDD